MLQNLDLNALAAEIHAANAHWWHDPATGDRLDRNKGEMLMLIVSELSEAMEGERKDLMDDHLPHRKMAEFELADVLIRVFDFAGGWGYRLHNCYALDGFVCQNKAEALLRFVGYVHRAYEATECGERDTVIGDYLSIIVAGVGAYGQKHGYDLLGAMAEKRAYNAQRADHKAAARLAEGGKKW